jgi:small-conductance mechanosensitive channel
MLMRFKLGGLRQILTTDPMVILMPLIVFVVVLAVGWIVRHLVLRALRAWTSRTQSRPGLILQQALRGPTLIWVLILAVHVAVQSSDLPAVVSDRAADLLAGLWIFSLTIMCMRLARDLVRTYGSQIPGALPVTTLTQNLAQIIVLILGILVLLAQYRKPITPILTALGVGGLAVALALQDTLSNLFSGFYVAVAGQIRLGDYIKMNSGEEGYVADIGWRSTTIRSLNNNMIIVPNSKLAQAIVTNYYLPAKNLSTSVQVNVGYDSDPAHIEQLLLEVGAATAGVIPGMLTEPAPTATFEPGFAENSMGFSLNFQVAEFANQFTVRQELRKRIVEHFRERGVSLSPRPKLVYVERESTH